MDRRRNPFAPGAGTRPPELAGREQIIEDASVAFERIREGRPAKSQMLLGLRGVGKTVLLNELDRVAEQLGYLTIHIEAPEDRSLAQMLVPPLRGVLYKLSASEKAKILATKGLRVLQSFASVFKASAGGVELGVAEPGVADSGNLENDLPELLLLVAEAARNGDLMPGMLPPCLRSPLPTRLAPPRLPSRRSTMASSGFVSTGSRHGSAITCVRWPSWARDRTGPATSRTCWA